MNLDLKSIVLYLNIQGFSAKEIHENINMTLGSGAIGYSTINKYIRSQSFSQQNKSIKNSENLMLDEENKILIVNALKNFPFSSVREIAKMTYIPKSTVYRILTQQLNYVNKHLKWVPHSLKPSQLIQRVDASKELLKILAKVKKSNKYLFYTGDESWFYLNTYYNQQWFPEGETPSKRVKKMIDSKKFMITVLWNSEEFLLVEALDDNMKFNEDYFINKILEKIVLKTSEDREQ